MSLSGIKISEEAMVAYNKLKLEKNVRAIVFKINDAQTEVVVEKTYPLEATLKDVTDELPTKEARYVTYDLVVPQDGCETTKLTFICWAPQDASGRSKMSYTTTKSACLDNWHGI